MQPADSSWQPVHTVYVPADDYRPDLTAEWSARALEACARLDGIEGVCAAVGVEGHLRGAVAERVGVKLSQEPIEDLRVDFEDGYGDRNDEIEDADALAFVTRANEASKSGHAPASVGIRIKDLDERNRRRGLRTLGLVVSAFMETAGTLPSRFVTTIPKVSNVTQIQHAVAACEELEAKHGLPRGSLRLEVQVETPEAIIGVDGRSPLPQIIQAGDSRVSGLHFGTYDYSAALGIAADFQSLDHPAADFAKSVMQVVAAGSGVAISDGSTNILPVGDDSSLRAGLDLHFRLVRRSLERGFYQGWDLHPAQLPTRYIANYRFYRSALPGAIARLRATGDPAQGNRTERTVLEEPATVTALTGFLRRGIRCGAIDEDEVAGLPGFTGSDRARVSDDE